MPSFSQAIGPPRAPTLAKVGLAGNSMTQDSVAAPVGWSTNAKPEGIVPGGQGTTQYSLDVDNKEMNLESKMKGLTVDEDSPNLIDHNGNSVESNNAVDHVVESSSIEQSELMAATIPKEVAQEVVRRQLPVY